MYSRVYATVVFSEESSSLSKGDEDDADGDDGC
jgi:hypothetical protein